VNLNFEYDLKTHLTKVTRKPKNLAFTIDKDKTCHHFDLAAQKGYQKICLRFVAKGGEKHLVIGNLKRVIQCRYKKNLEEDRFATTVLFKSDIGLVHIDDCTLFRLSDRDSLSLVSPLPVSPKESVEMDTIPGAAQSRLLSSIYFEHGLDVVNDTQNLEKAITEIRKQASKNCLFLVVGHTDGTGSAAQNAALSLNRASVVSQILSAQVPGIQVNYEGKGASETSLLPNPALRRADVYLIECDADKE
jgi:outer membrane protein OmpA-like peptidoglycan-associated protein